MSKPVVTLAATLVVLVVVYLGYQLLAPKVNRCEGIFQQTSVTLGAKLDVVKAKGETALGRQKVQELTERAQLAALNLKSCCIVVERADFERCAQRFKKLDADLERVTTALKEAETAKTQGNAALATQKIAEVHEGVRAIEATSSEFARQVEQIKERGPAAPVAKTAPASGTVMATGGGSEKESNNTILEANPISLGATVAGEIFSAEDQDYFRVGNASTLRDLIKVSVLNESTTLRPQLVGYDANKSQLFVTAEYILDVTPGENVERTLVAEPRKDFYLRVSSVGGSGKYKLLVTPQKAYDEYEPNDSAATAIALKTDRTITANIMDPRDIDWYRFTGITAAKKIRVRLTNRSETLRPYIVLYDQNKAATAATAAYSSDVTPGADLEPAFPVEPGKDFYLRISSLGGEGAYELKVSQE